MAGINGTVCCKVFRRPGKGSGGKVGRAFDTRFHAGFAGARRVDAGAVEQGGASARGLFVARDPGLAAAVADAVFGGGRGFGRAGAPFDSAVEVDDLAHRAILPPARRRSNRVLWRHDMGDFIDLTASDGFTLSAYKAGPDHATVGLVVIQEIFGVNGHVRSV